MSDRDSLDLEQFKFRGLHPDILIGTASDRYAGWIGQIYSGDRYDGRTSRRTQKFGKKTFVSEVLPVDSAEEYFDHFRTLEIDYTFYRVLVDEQGERTQNYHVLRKYKEHLRGGDRLLLKAPQIVFAQKLRRDGEYMENEAYLNPDVFTRQFYQPATELLGEALSGFIFEQEYQRKQERLPLEGMADSLDKFFRAIPGDDRYHVELRTGTYLTKSVLDALRANGVGQIFSHWTWLPPLIEQFEKSGRTFFNAGRQAVIRLMTPRGVRYEDAYAQAHPFDKLVQGMMSPRMVEDTVQLMQSAVTNNVKVNVVINNRAGGNAPLIARTIAQHYLALQEKEGALSSPE